MEVEIDLRYPIGEFDDVEYSESARKERLLDIKYLPRLLEHAVLNLDDTQLCTPYRDGGWTILQVVHHVADSHMNGYCRFKLGITEEHPVIKPYDENAWAVLDDVKALPPNVSLTLLHALHQRWYEAIRDLAEGDLTSRTVYHPASNRTLSLWTLLGMYSWHGKHHTAHITRLRDRMGWR